MPLASGFERDVQQLWHTFLRRIEPFRPDLYRYCRALARSVWYAEDLLQETLLRAFAKLGDLSVPLDSPKAYLLRVASNLWIDQMRRTYELALLGESEMTFDSEAHLEVRGAAHRLLQSLSPQERTAVVLKDVFDLELGEIAAILETTSGAIKSALHGGRRKLSTAGPRRRVDEQVVEKFVELFNARDLEGLAALLRADVKGEVIGMGYWQGPTACRDNPIYYSLFLEHGDSRAERHVLDSEPIVLLRYTHEGESVRVVRNVMRFETDDELITRLQFFTLCPQALLEVADRLRLPSVTNGYGPWSPDFLSLRKQPEYQAWQRKHS
jgi:RNA polymerase sigma-70 factor (ECF subfamily)